MRVVIDTNVWVSGLLKPANPPGQVLKAIYDKRVVAVSSAHLWAELQRAVSYGSVRRVLERDGVWPHVQRCVVLFTQTPVYRSFGITYPHPVTACSIQ